MNEQILKVTEQAVKWIVLIVLIVSSISLLVVFQAGYIPEELTARAVPLAILAGLTSIAAALIFKK
ncbi:hypothetical protein [Jeotgalibacillus proteolyticus]|uniref:Uncharacterized protein n=1 Tax=Jeotgalibacillus proteolyticus TaxID=2082395 RepID=A0A2S5GAE7_9BACL|nr:hypothetical protein [Jeotgalibacillus proteolyticus]PPA69883.1 hypothetical protein C4B60_15240 [Jeotgalibacillus proteolyticus]